MLLFAMSGGSMSDSPLNAALRQFEAAEANLIKAEKLLAEIELLKRRNRANQKKKA